MDRLERAPGKERGDMRRHLGPLSSALIQNRRSAFTLIELLVVVAIIAILAGMLMPALQNARFQAQKTRGMNNLRQVALGAHMYFNDCNGHFPNNSVHNGNCSLTLLLTYGVSNILYATINNRPEPNYYCIVDPTGISPRGVIMCNMNLMGGIDPSLVGTYRHSLTDVKRPATTFLIAHNFEIATSTPIHADQLLDGSFAGTYNPPYWNKGLYYYFVDGRMEFFPWKGSGLSKWWDFHPLYPSSYPSDWYSGGYLLWGP